MKFCCISISCSLDNGIIGLNVFKTSFDYIYVRSTIIIFTKSVLISSNCILIILGTRNYRKSNDC